MFHRVLVPALAILSLVLPLSAWAGGLPMLCLPLDGATAKNADASAQRVAAALGKEVESVSVRQNDGQWYLTFYLNFNCDHVKLAEIDAALKGSAVSIRRDSLRLFADVILEIDAPAQSAEKLLTELKTLKSVKVEQSQREGNTLLVTLKLPAPESDFRRLAEFGQVPFQKLTFQSEGPGGADFNARELPTYEELRLITEKHGAQLQGLRWNYWHCRTLGCVAGGADRTTAQAASAR